MRVTVPIGPSGWWLSGAPDIFKIKIGGKVSNHFLKLLLQFSVECRVSSPPPAPGTVLTQPFIYLHSRTFPKTYVHFNKSCLSQYSRGGKSLYMSSTALLGGVECRRGMEKPGLAAASCLFIISGRASLA